MANLALVETKRITVYSCAAYILCPETREIFDGKIENREFTLHFRCIDHRGFQKGFDYSVRKMSLILRSKEKDAILYGP
jgi:hypothetical protein